MRKLSYCPKDLLVGFYKKKVPRGPFFDGQVSVISSYNKLGETVLLSFIPEQASKERKNIFLGKLGNTYHDSVFKNNPFEKSTDEYNGFHSYTERFNLGNGNIIQQVQRLLTLEVKDKPKGSLYNTGFKVKGRIGIHIDGVSAGRFHGSKRQIYSRNIEVLQKFIYDNPSHEFYQFGQGLKKDESILPSGVSVPVNGNKEGLFQRVVDCLNGSVESAIDLAATCEYFICLNSSFYHIAAALDCKVICIINNPKIEECYLPILINEMPPVLAPYDVFDKVWLYPQSVHLHQDGGNDLVPIFSEENLKRAINGEVYPFWRDDYLNLIHEFRR